jgi:hypothetical protein
LPEQEAAMEELEREYHRLNANYEVSCDNCGKKQVGPSWSRLGFVTQAKRQEQLAPSLCTHTIYLFYKCIARSAPPAASLKSSKTNQFSADLADEVFHLAYVLAINSLQTSSEVLRHAWFGVGA